MARSNDVVINVQTPPAPQQYDAAGATSVAVTIESPIARAMRPAMKRLTYEDLRARHPDDEGMRFADAMQGRNLVFFTKRMLREAA